MKKNYLMIVLMSTPFNSFAGTETFSVTHVGVDVSQKTLFVGVSPAAITSSCNALAEFKWNLADSGINEIQALVLAAEVAGKKIQIGVSEGGVCVKGQPTGSWVRIQN